MNKFMTKAIQELETFLFSKTPEVSTYTTTGNISLIIGIDPDVTKSGVATISKPSKNLNLQNLSFFELYKYLETNCFLIGKVVIEAGWLNKSNWHLKGDKAKYAAAIGNRTGQNHAVGQKIVEMCEFLNLDYELVKPQKSKTDAKKFKMLSGYEGRTNAEMRDAAMLILER